MWLQGSIAVTVAALATLVIVPRIRALAIKLGAIDRPGGRKQHSGAIPRLGGIALMSGIAIGVGAGIAVGGASAFDKSSPEEVAKFSLALGLIFALGVFDDIRSISIPLKIGVQVLSAALLVDAGWSFQVLHLPVLGPVDLGSLAPVLSLIWIVGITNAVNLLDGIDGLASGISAIIAMSFLILAATHGDPIAVLVSAGMAGACIGFLHHNWSPAKIFMGDSGALTLGFLLSSISLNSSLKAPAAVAVLVPILALGLPAIDTLLTMAVRFLESPGHPILRRIANMFQADRRHLHHLLQYLEPRRSWIVLRLYGLAVVFCGMALSVALTKSARLGITLIVVEIIVVAIVRLLGMHARAKVVIPVDPRPGIELVLSLDAAEPPATSVVPLLRHRV